MAEKIKFDENEDLLVSTEQICKLFDISRAALNKWVSSGCPKHSRGWFLLKDVLEWKGDNVSEKMQEPRNFAEFVNFFEVYKFTKITKNICKKTRRKEERKWLKKSSLMRMKIC